MYRLLGPTGDGVIDRPGASTAPTRGRTVDAIVDVGVVSPGRVPFGVTRPPLRFLTVMGRDYVM